MNLDEVSSDTLNSICLFLDHQNDLLSLAAAGHRYYEHANSENVWKHICLESWQDKICPPTATISEHLRTLSENELLNIVGMYSSYWCQTDLDVISQAKIVKLLECSSHEYDWKSAIHWAKNMQEWKVTYKLAQKDSVRLDILPQELCDRFWRWQFHPHMVQEVAAGLQIDGRFSEEGSYVSSFQEGVVMMWRYVRSDCIQIADHPALQASRTQDWDWMLHNQFGFFSSISKEQYDQLVASDLPSFFPNQDNHDAAEAGGAVGNGEMTVGNNGYSSAEEMDVEEGVWHDSLN
jgi:hypothetical protein